MTRPTLNEFTDWKHHPVGRWFFDHLQETADDLAADNGRAVGRLQDKDSDHMKCVFTAGHVAGIEYVVDIDPFEEERETREDSEEE
jgi:hypothetical protein